jgi:hypothetical protein
MRVLALIASTAVAAVIAATSASAAVPLGSDAAVSEWPSWPYEASCYSIFNPVEAFSGPAEAEFGSLASEGALRDVLNDPALSWLGLPQDHWRLVSEDDTEAVFESGALSSPFPQWVLLQRGGEGWKLAGNGNCTPRTVLHGLAGVPWTLAGDQPALGWNTRRIRVDLGPGPCASGMSENARARKPIFRQLGRRLLMTILLEPLPPGVYTCQGVLDPPLMVQLPGRLGKRTLFDAGSFPPQPASEPASG